MATAHLGRYEVERDRLPAVCMRCGEPATVRKRKGFAWHPPWVIVLIFVAVLVYIIVAAILTKRMTVQAPLCDKHRNHWLGRALIIWLSLAGLLALGFGGFMLAAALEDERGGQSELFPFVCIGSLVAGLVWLIVLAVLQTTAIRPTEITDRSITLTGVSPLFVEAVDKERERLEADLEDYDRPRSRRPPRQSREFYDPDVPRPRRSDDAFRQDEP